jgi:hypothetical protein
MEAQLLAPAAVLVAWSLIMLLWVLLTRLSAFASAKLSLAEAEAGTRYQDVEAVLPSRVNWKSHNFTHLMEQPTLFYATIAILAIAGQGSELNVMLAWTYVGLRVVHSLWQALVNTIPVRITLFGLSTLCLVVLAINAVRATVFAG